MKYYPVSGKNVFCLKGTQIDTGNGDDIINISKYGKMWVKKQNDTY